MQEVLNLVNVSLRAWRLVLSFPAVGLLQPGGGIAPSALNVRAFVLGAYLREGVFEEETIL